MPEPIISVATFAKQMDWKANPDKVKDFIGQQIGNIKSMKQAFDNAAGNASEELPKFQLYGLMVPEWSNGQDYESQEYKNYAESYLGHLKSECEKIGVEVIDFYKDVATDEEKEYLYQLKALGSNLDLLKLNAITRNIDKKHLHLDSNTIIRDVDNLYEETFKLSEQKDGFNASYYSQSGKFISPHSKAVYLGPSSTFPEILDKHKKIYLEKYKDDLSRKIPQSNEIYVHCFGNAFVEAGLATTDRSYHEDQNKVRFLHSANLQNNAYAFSKHIITAVNRSWSQGPGKVDSLEGLKNIRCSSSENDQLKNIDFPAYLYIVKKMTHPDLPDDQRALLKSMSDEETDKFIIKNFFNAVFNTQDLALIGSLIRTIPKNEMGNPIRDDLARFLKDEGSVEFIKKLDTVPANVTKADLCTIDEFIYPYDEDSAKKLRRLSVSIEQNRHVEIKQEIPELTKEVISFFANEDNELLTSIKATAELTIENYLKDKSCVEDTPIAGLKEILKNLAINTVIKSLVMNDSEIQASLNNLTESQRETVKNKLYQFTNKGFILNDASKSEAIKIILEDISKIKFEAQKKDFFDIPEVQAYKNVLNNLCAKTDNSDINELIIKVMSEALISAVKELNAGNIGPSAKEMLAHLEQHLTTAAQNNNVHINAELENDDIANSAIGQLKAIKQNLTLEAQNKYIDLNHEEPLLSNSQNSVTQDTSIKFKEFKEKFKMNTTPEDLESDNTFDISCGG